MSTKRRDVFQSACDFLAKREHSREELARKLFRRCFDEALIEDILDIISREGLQSDERFTESFVHHSVSKGQGPNKIKQALRQRGIDAVLIAKYLDAVSIDWLSLVEQVRVKKYGEKLPADYQNRVKQSQFLYSRGFTSEQINQVL